MCGFFIAQKWSCTVSAKVYLFKSEQMSMELLKRKQVAQLFGVAANTVRVWERQGIISPCCHINKRPRYAKEDVKKLLNPKTKTDGANTND